MKIFRIYIAPLFWLLLICISPELANAQIGVKLGSTISNFYYTDTEMNPSIGYDIDLRPYLGYEIEWIQLSDQKPLVSYYLGGYYNFQFSNRFSLRPEMGFTQKGLNFSQSKYERIIYRVKISYLEIPLSVSYKYIKKESFVGELYIGGFGAFKLNAIKKVAYQNSSAEKTKINCVNNFDAGIHFGLNFKYKVFAKFILFDFRVFSGLSDVFYIPEDQISLYYNTQKTKITGFNLTLGYEF